MAPVNPSASPGSRPVAAGETLATMLLDAIITSAMDAIVALDAAQRIVLFNPAAEAMFRCSAADVLGSPLDRFLPPHLQAVHREQVAAFAATGDPSRAMGHLRPLSAVRADGEVFPIEAAIARVPLSGQPFTAAIIRDITSRVEAEAALHRQAALLDLAYDAIFTWDRDGRIISWNRGAERLYGYTRDEAVGQICHALLRTRHPDGFPAVLADLERNAAWEGELIHTRRDGGEVVVQSRLALVDHDAQRYVLVLEAARDVTARKTAELERSASRQREAAARTEAAAAAAARDHLREILNGLPNGVLLVAAPDAHIEFANAAMRELVFATRDSRGTTPVLGRDFSFVRFDGTPLPADEQPIIRALRGERVENQQLLLQRRDGTSLPVEVDAVPRYGPGGTLSSAVVGVHDISRMRQAEQFKDDFLALVSHELRTPLTAIHGGARVLANRPDLDAAMRAELLHDVIAESQRLDRLLSNLLTLADVLGGRLHVATEPVPIAPLAQRIVAEIAARNPAHAFVVDAGPRLAVAEADPDLLEEVLRNLYENAVKYSPHGGTVRTAVTVVGEAIATRVSDEGIGIAPEYVATVFERFRRVGGESTARGMGLGLYLSRALVEAQGGRIEASSPGIGHGATLTFTLPAARQRRPGRRTT